MKAKALGTEIVKRRERTSAEYECGLVVEGGYPGVKNDTMCFKLWKWIGIFTEKCSTNRGTDLEAKLQSSVLDTLSLR